MRAAVVSPSPRRFVLLVLGLILLLLIAVMPAQAQEHQGDRVMSPDVGSSQVETMLVDRAG